jgi:hypothetical protein
VVDGVFGPINSHRLELELMHVHQSGLMHLNHTHLVAKGETQLLAKLQVLQCMAGISWARTSRQQQMVDDAVLLSLWGWRATCSAQMACAAWRQQKGRNWHRNRNW